MEAWETINIEEDEFARGRLSIASRRISFSTGPKGGPVHVGEQDLYAIQIVRSVAEVAASSQENWISAAPDSGVSLLPGRSINVSSA